jgi:hypothetical protein
MVPPQGPHEGPFAAPKCLVENYNQLRHFPGDYHLATVFLSERLKHSTQVYVQAG